jgi:hypothetical protein
VILSKGLPVYDSEGKIVEWPGLIWISPTEKKLKTNSDQVRSGQKKFEITKP